MPDFQFDGKGVRITGTVPGSPAQKAGLQNGDIIVFVKDTKITNLNDFAEVLRSVKPGEKITVKYNRGGKITQVDLVAAAR